MLLLLLLLIPLLVNCNLSRLQWLLDLLARDCRLQWLLDLLARDCCVMLTPVCKYCLNVSEERENVCANTCINLTLLHVFIR